jgi:hypothetical protein
MGERQLAHPGAMTSGIIYAHVRAEQDRIRRDHKTAQERRQARHRARQRCEDLTEFLGRLRCPRWHPDEAADLLRRTRVAAREIEWLVTGRWYQQRRPRRQPITPGALNRLDDLVELLDEAIRDAPVGEADELGVRHLAIEFATTLAAGVEALAVPRSQP